MKQWVSFSLEPDSYWTKTPREIAIVFAGKAMQFTREHNERAWIAWHFAALPRTKRLPPLRRMMIRDRDRRPQSEQQMIAIAKQWTTLFGGAVIRKTDQGIS